MVDTQERVIYLKFSQFCRWTETTRDLKRCHEQNWVQLLSYTQ